MSRKKRKGLYWGVILKEFRDQSGLSQDEIGEIIGYSKRQRSSGNVSDIENGKLPITEDKIRLWVSACHKNIFDFYKRAGEIDLSSFLKNRSN